MQNNSIIQGRLLSTQDLAEIRTLLAEHPSWNRTRLSQELCRRCEWRNEAGQIKDMACRTLLLKLQERGWIELPASQNPLVNDSRNRRPVVVPHDDSPFHSSLEALRPLRVERVTPHLVETFVEVDRFSGACYRAAGWIAVGRTTGRGRNASGLAPQGLIKDVLLKPLHGSFRSQLCS